MASLRCCLDVQDVQRNRYTAHIHPPNNEDLGVRFLIKDLTEESYKSMLARKESDRLKSAEIRAALDAFLGASIDLFRRIDVDKTYTKVEGEAIASEVFKELEALRTFIGDALLGIGRSFDCSVPYIQESWYVDHGKPSTLLRRQRELAIQLLAYRQEEAAALAERDARRAEYLTAKALQDEALRTLQNLQASILALEAENRAKRKAGEAVSADITALLKRQRAEVKDAEEIARTLNEQAWAAHHAFDAAELRMQRARYYN